MPNRLFPLLTLAVALFVTGSAIVSMADHSSPTVQTGPVPVQQKFGAESIPVLPVVVVRPDPVVPTLATITVRPDRIEPATVRVDRDGNVDQSLALARVSGVATLPGGGFDMPYYSFAKTLRRANKE